jgi:ABC-type branched-subunit amino acid transport system substrate-binding protein
VVGILLGLYFGVPKVIDVFWPKEFKIAVIGPITGSENQTWAAIKAGLDDARNSSLFDDLTARGIKLEFVDRDDQGNQTITQEVARDVCNDSSYILVMGFVETSVAQRALPFFGQCKIPVILIATTSTDLTHVNETVWTQPILRLAPSNYQQSAQIVSGLGDTFGTDPCNLLVLKDKDNPGYSNNLTDEFRRAILDAKRTRCEPEVQEYEPEKPDKLEKMLVERLSTHEKKLDGVLLFGMTAKATSLVKAIAHVRKRLGLAQGRPLVVVSDGSTNQQLINDAGDDTECVWGVFPFGEPRDDFADSVNWSKNKYLTAPSFYAYGYDAVIVAHRVIMATAPRVSRNAISDQFRALSTQKVFLKGMDGVYEFGTDGGLHSFWDKDRKTQLDQFHLWQVQRKNGGLSWQHRRRRESLLAGCQAK